MKGYDKKFAVVTENDLVSDDTHHSECCTYDQTFVRMGLPQIDHTSLNDLFQRYIPVFSLCHIFIQLHPLLHGWQDLWYTQTSQAALEVLTLIFKSLKSLQRYGRNYLYPVDWLCPKWSLLKMSILISYIKQLPGIFY